MTEEISEARMFEVALHAACKQRDEAERENARLRERVALLAYALAEVSAAPVVRVDDDQFSLLVREGEGRFQ